MNKQSTKSLVFNFIAFLVLHSVAKASDTLYFAGKINIAKSVSYDYILRFTINEQNQVIGYSLTDAKGPNETKTKILGNFDKIANTISYEEKNVLRSKIDLHKNDLCFVKATLKIRKNKTIETMSGKFIGQNLSSNTECANGEIKLINTDKVKQILLKQASADSIKENQIKNGKTADLQSSPIKLGDNAIKQLPFSGSYLKLSIWDNGQIDGDIISIMLNDKYILEKYKINGSFKIMELELPNQEINALKFFAVNEGDVPPNSAVIKIESKTEHYTIEMLAKTNDVRTIHLSSKKQ